MKHVTMRLEVSRVSAGCSTIACGNETALVRRVIPLRAGREDTARGPRRMRSRAPKKWACANNYRKHFPNQSPLSAIKGRVPSAHFDGLRLMTIKFKGVDLDGDLERIIPHVAAADEYGGALQQLQTVWD